MTIELAEHALSIDVTLEAFPPDVQRRLDQRAAWRRHLAQSGTAFEFVVNDLGRWPPGSTVTVAFNGGDTDLHAQIASSTRQISDACNLELDFGLDPLTSTYRRWSDQDTNYAADIRISFDQRGFWSHVGMDSVDPTVGAPTGLIGGRPHQRSMNFGGFDRELPMNWERTVRHEFMHALAFHHEHQNMRGACQAEFRWNDDDGYVRTRENGRFVVDAEGRQPGIYTYLSGAPNNWTRGTVDRNLRTTERAEMTAGPFDQASIMLYRFPPFFYRSNPSPCAPEGLGVDLSDGDKRGLALLYPGQANEIDALLDRAAASQQSLDDLLAVGAAGRLESVSLDPSADEQWALGASVVLNRFLKGNK